MAKRQNRYKPRQFGDKLSNIEKYNAENPSGPNTTHGSRNKHIRKRYSDARTKEGALLKGVMCDLVEDFGGEACLNAGQRLIMNKIKSKLIVLMQIGSYADTLESIIYNGAVLPCMNETYLRYSESLRRDLITLYDFAQKKPGDKIPDLTQYLQSKKKE